MNQFSRTGLLLGEEGLERLHRARVAVFGLGGVGGHCCEALIRSGIGAICLVDNDTVSLTNLNRQLVALHSTVGQPKTEALKKRLKDINPEAEIETRQMFYLPETAEEIDLSRFTYVVDAIDTVSAKLELISRCHELNVPIISALGAGNRLDPSQLRVMDIMKTSGCPLAKAVRVGCRKRGIEHLKVACSLEEPMTPGESGEPLPPGKHAVPGSSAFVPPAMGLLLASQVVRDIALGEG